MKDIVLKNLKKRFASYADLIEACDDDVLQQTVDVPSHKTLKQHLWCVIGARQSYTRALIAGEWQGFECSMTHYDVKNFRGALTQSTDDFVRATEDISDWSEGRLELLAALSEHEVMHEGQIIRHMLAIGRTLPASWRWA